MDIVSAVDVNGVSVVDVDTVSVLVLDTSLVGLSPVPGPPGPGLSPVCPVLV